MASSLPSSSCWHSVLLVAMLLVVVMDQMAMAYMYDDIEIVWGDDHSFFYMDDAGDDEILALCLDQTHGSGFHSKEAYLYARFDVDLMLVPDNSAGTVTTLYVSPSIDLRPPPRQYAMSGRGHRAPRLSIGGEILRM